MHGPWLLVLAWAGLFQLAWCRADKGVSRSRCYKPTWFSAPSGDTLPRRGVLYLHGEPELWRGPGRLTKVGTSVWRIDLDLEVGARVEIWRTPMRAIDDWREPTEPPRIVAGDDLTIDQSVAAVRARWTYDGTTTETLVVPRSRSDGTWHLAIHIPNSERHGGQLELIAIRFDGSEVVIAQPVGTPRWTIALLGAIAIALALLAAPRLVPAAPAIACRVRLPRVWVVRNRSRARAKSR